MKAILLIIITFTFFPLVISNVSAMCAADTMEWWEPCNDTGSYSDGIYIKYSILIPLLTVIILVIGIVSLVYWRKRK